MKILKLIGLLYCLIGFTQTQNETLLKHLDSVTTYVDRVVDVTPGTSVIITKNNQTFYTAANGLSSIELNIKNTIDTKYDLASIAKVFTGYAIATLEVEGKLSTQDHIQKYLPNFPVYDHPITVGHLVHHTSGIKNWTSLIHQMGWSNEDRITTVQLLRLIYAQKSLNFISGERYQYSNSGYVLLTKIIENITGQSFASWTQEHIFQPLEMTHTFFNEDTHKVIVGMASAYMLKGNECIREAYNTSALGSSSLISNATDMAKWMNFLLFPPEDKQAIINKMFSTKKLNNGIENNYAYGIEISSHNDVKTIGHSGSWASFTSEMTIIPEQKIGVFFANNYRVHTGSIMSLYLDVVLPFKPENSEENKQEDNETNASESTSEAIDTSVAHLDQFIGKFKLGEAWYLDITRKGNQLFTRATSENTFEMIPVNKTTFRVRAYGNRTITFKFDKDGVVNALEYNDINAPRVAETFYFNKDEFKKYEGVYYCTELDAVYELKTEDNALTYKNIKSGKYSLFSVSDTFFFSEEGLLSKIEFNMDKKKNVIGFRQINSKKETLFSFNKAN